jgi:putative transcriptional regulator
VSSLQGHLLIASPGELDPDFSQTVILLIEHSEGQAVGLVLNRPTTTTVKELFDKAHYGNRYIYSGGPVPGPLMALHSCEDHGEIEVAAGVYYSVKKKSLEKVVRIASPTQRIFDGHAGWGPGQVEEQIERGGWQVKPAAASEIFYDEQDLWDRLVSSS